MNEILQSCKERQTICNEINTIFTTIATKTIHPITNLSNYDNSSLSAIKSSNTKEEVTYRKLTLDEIQILKDNNNTYSISSNDNTNKNTSSFENVFIIHPKATTTNNSTTSEISIKNYLKNNIKNNNFSNVIILILSSLSLFDKNNNNNTCASESLSLLPKGLYNNTLIKNSIIDASSYVYNNTVISNTYIGHNVSIIDCCHVISCDDDNDITSNNDEIDITIGPESSGGRITKVCPESTLIHICNDLGFLSNTNNTPTFSSLKNKSSSSSLVIHNILEKNSKIIKCTTIKKIHLRTNCIIKDINTINNTILLSNSIIQSCNIIQNVYCQWNTKITSCSSISNCLCMEYSVTGPNSFVCSSVIGPDTHVSNGEIYNSLLGSNVASHHQSLIISMIAINGRCNIGYGSNIGSNHTSRSPDQEIFVAEGTFFGLDCSIKFPINLLSSPYSIIATSVQIPNYFILKNMPFSLLLNANNTQNNQGNDKIMVLPAWVIQYSPYTIERNEKKYLTRNKSIYHKFYLSYSIYRKDIIQLCIVGRDILLQNIKNDNDSNNMHAMSMKAIKNGIVYYTEFIQRFALCALYMHVQHLYDIWKKRNDVTIDQGKPPIDRHTTIQQLFLNCNHNKSSTTSTTANIQNNDNDLNNLYLPFANYDYSKEDNNNNNNTNNNIIPIITNYQIQILLQEFNNKSNNTKIISLLKEYIKLETNYTNRIIQSKLKDETRGKKVIPYYELGHDDTRIDDVVVKDSTMKLNLLIDNLNLIFDDWWGLNVVDDGDNTDSGNALSSRL